VWGELVATEKQYAFFKSLYDEENERAKILAEHAKNNLGLATLYSAFILFVVEKQVADIAWLGKLLFCGAILCMLGAFLLSLMATQIAAYQIPNEPTDIIEGFGDDPPTDEEFFDDRIIDYALACETNGSVNDRKADMLRYARYLLLGGIALHASYFVARILTT
jgi:hypothetical protein